MGKKRRAAGILTAVLAAAALLSACAAEETAAPSDTPEPEGAGFVYVPEYSRLPDCEWASCAALCGERLLLGGAEGAEPMLYSAPLTGGEPERFEGFEAAPTPEGAEGSGSICGLCATPDGGFAAVERSFASSQAEEPEGEMASATSTDIAPVYESCESYILHIYDSSGDERAAKDISELLDGDGAGVTGCAADAAGYIYLCLSDGSALVFDRGGGFVSRALGDGAFTGLAALGDGVYGVTADDAGTCLLPIDPVNGSAGEAELTLPAGAQVLSSGTEHSLLWSDGERLMALADDETEPETLLYWTDAGIDAAFLSWLGQNAEGDILCLVHDADGLWLLRLMSTPASELAERETLTLAGVGISSSIVSEAARFNRSGGVLIELRDYSTGTDLSADVERLNTDILTGRVPDILYTNGLDTASLAESGYLTDLAPYIAADAELSNALLSSYAAAEKLYVAADAFVLNTWAGSASLEGMKPELETLRTLASELPGGCTLLGPDMAGRALFSELCGHELSHFVDWESGSCDFTSGGFAALLEFCASLPEGGASSADSDAGRIAEGSQLLVSLHLGGDFSAYTAAKSACGGELALLGVPGGEGRAELELMPGLAMSAACVDTDAAWSFIRQLLTEDCQSGSARMTGLPTNRVALEARLEAETGSNAVYYYQDYACEADFTEEDASLILAVCEDAIPAPGTDSAQVQRLVDEEASRFFAGECTAADCAAVVQDRVSVYLEEQS